MIASLNQSSSISSLGSTLLSSLGSTLISAAAMFTTRSCKAAKDECGIAFWLDPQAHPTPFDSMALSGNQIFKCLDPMARAGRPDLDLAEMKPELAWALFRERHRDRHGIILGDRLFHVADDPAIVDLRKPQVARLQQRGVGLANAIDLSDKAFDIPRPVPVPGLELVFLGIEVLFPSRYGLVLDKLEAVVDAIAGRQRCGEHEACFEHPGLAALQVEWKNVGRVDEEVGPEIFALRIPGDLAQIGLQLVFCGAPGEVGVGLVKAELGKR